MSSPDSSPVDELKKRAKGYIKKQVRKAKDDNLVGQLKAFAKGDAAGMDRAVNKAARKAQLKAVWESGGALRTVGPGPQVYHTGSNPTADGRTVEVGKGAFGGDMMIIDKAQMLQATHPGPAKVNGAAVQCYDITGSNLIVVASNGSDELPPLKAWLDNNADVYIAKTSMTDILGDQAHYMIDLDEDEAAAEMGRLAALYVSITEEQLSDDISRRILSFYRSGADPKTFDAGSAVSRAKSKEALLWVKDSGPPEGVRTARFIQGYEMHQNTKAGRPDAASIYYKGGEETIGVSVSTFEICYCDSQRYVVSNARAQIIRHGIEMLAKPFGTVGSEATEHAALGSALGDALRSLVEIVHGEGEDGAAEKLGKLIQVEFSQTGVITGDWKGKGARERHDLLPCNIEIRDVGGAAGVKGVGFKIGDVESSLLGMVE